MTLRSRFWFPLAVAAIGFASARVSTQKGPALPDVLQAAGDYLVRYSQQLGAVAAEEQYAQSDTSLTGGLAIRLVSDVVFLGAGGGGVIGFRDVVSVDGASVHKRDDRLLTLFTTSPASSLQPARRITDESARYYRSPNLRVLDQPTLALEFLKTENQERSAFKLDSVKTIKGAEVAIVKFTERNTPRLLPSPENGPAEGRFWIEVATGTVRQTELAFPGKGADIKAAVTYAAEPKLGLWLPVEMTQRIDVYAGAGVSNMSGGNGSNIGGARGHEGLEGRLSYSKFRQMPVDLSTIK